MEIFGRQSLLQVIRSMESSSEYQQMLGVLLKYEIQMLLQRLAETGEESVVMSMSIADGTLSVIGSDYGEQFIQNPGSAGQVVTDFKEQFLKYCHNTRFLKRNSEVKEVNNDTGIESRDSSCTPTEIHSPPASTGRARRGRPPRKKQVDQTDQTVAELVKNIMKQSKEKEKKIMKQAQEKKISNPRINSRGMRSQRGRKLKPRVLERDSVQVQKQRESHLNDSSNQGNKIREKMVIANEAVDDTVTQLVQNIKAQAEVREREKFRVLSCFDRKRNRSQANFEYTTDLIDVTGDAHTSKKPRTIAQCFPSLTDPLETTSNYSPSAHIEVKVEPCDNGYEYVLNSKAETVSELDCVSGVTERRESDYAGNISVVECSNESFDLDQSDIREIDVDNVEASSSEVSQAFIENGTEVIEEVPESGTEVDLTNMKIEIDTDYEEDIELPFVEEYYEKMDLHSGKMLLNQESTEDSQAEYLYKSSPRQRSSYNLVHNGYRYIKDKEGKGNTIYWKCGRFQCKGRVIQRNGENIRTQNHNHSPTYNFEAVQKKAESVKSGQSMLTPHTEKRGQQCYYQVP